MSDRKFSDIEIFQHSGKGIPLFMTGHTNCLQSDYLLGPGPRLIKGIYWAAVSQSLRNTVVDHQLHNGTISKLCYSTSVHLLVHYLNWNIPLMLRKGTYKIVFLQIWNLKSKQLDILFDTLNAEITKCHRNMSRSVHIDPEAIWIQ
jgi:hypothetical protein